MTELTHFFLCPLRPVGGSFAAFAASEQGVEKEARLAGNMRVFIWGISLHYQPGFHSSQVQMVEAWSLAGT